MENAISAHSFHYQISAIRIRSVCHAALNCPIKCTQIRASSCGKSVVKRFLTFSNRAFTGIAACVHMLPWQMNMSRTITYAPGTFCSVQPLLPQCGHLRLYSSYECVVKMSLRQLTLNSFAQALHRKLCFASCLAQRMTASTAASNTIPETISHAIRKPPCVFYSTHIIKHASGLVNSVTAVWCYELYLVCMIVL